MDFLSGGRLPGCDVPSSGETDLICGGNDVLSVFSVDTRPYTLEGCYFSGGIDINGNFPAEIMGVRGASGSMSPEVGIE